MHQFKHELSRNRKILIIGFFIALIGYDPGAMENSGSVTEKLVPSNVRITNSLSSGLEFAGLERTVSGFLKNWDLAGASVAVSRNGKLVYARGFGFADKEAGIEIQPYNKFRIASISKLVTAVAIMKLQESGKLSVYERVFGPGGILNDSIFMHPRDKRAYDITVAHLLSHEGGWTTRWGDQMFMPVTVAESMGMVPPVDTRTIVKFALGKYMHFTPGTGKSYSNLGYAILGLVIEKVSGMTYEEYCKKEVLEPLGIYDMTLAKNLSSEKAPFEVNYYEPGDAVLKPSIYDTTKIVPASNGGNDIEALGGAGAWIATAPDLLKLLLAIDGFSSRADILSDSSISFMTDNNNGYAPVGWKTTIMDGNWWRTGTFPGSACMIKRQPDGTAWAVLLNSSAWNGPEISASVNYMMMRALSHVKQWPDIDLFNNSVPIPLKEDVNF
ncbi:MAG: serine hydrolase domain-containing protein [Bacteroidales bacterium]